MDGFAMLHRSVRKKVLGGVSTVAQWKREQAAVLWARVRYPEIGKLPLTARSVCEKIKNEKQNHLSLGRRASTSAVLTFLLRRRPLSTSFCLYVTHLRRQPLSTPFHLYVTHLRRHFRLRFVSHPSSAPHLDKNAPVIEPRTYCTYLRRSTNCATEPHKGADLRSDTYPSYPAPKY